MEYEDEPRLIFSPLSDDEYCAFYDIEMQGFSDDLVFYTRLLKQQDRILELGCGTGRLSRRLADHCRFVTGLDISADMIHRAMQKPVANISYYTGDMAENYFPGRFDAIIIPYNSLNLLGSSDKVESCLKLCHKQLHASGKLLLDIYVPDEKMLSASGEKFFQFSIYDQKDGTKVIKETLKCYDQRYNKVTLEERYRIRHTASRELNRDLSHTLDLYAPAVEKWQKLLNDTGFHIKTCWGDYKLSPFSSGKSTSFLISAVPLRPSK